MCASQQQRVLVCECTHLPPHFTLALLSFNIQEPGSLLLITFVPHQSQNTEPLCVDLLTTWSSKSLVPIDNLVRGAAPVAFHQSQLQSQTGPK